MFNKHNSSRDCIKLDGFALPTGVRSHRNWQILKSIALQILILWRCHGKQWQVIEKIEKSESTYSGLFCR